MRNPSFSGINQKGENSMNDIIAVSIRVGTNMILREVLVDLLESKGLKAHASNSKDVSSDHILQVILPEGLYRICKGDSGMSKDIYVTIEELIDLVAISKRKEVVIDPTSANPTEMVVNCKGNPQLSQLIKKSLYLAGKCWARGGAVLAGTPEKFIYSTPMGVSNNERLLPSWVESLVTPETFLAALNQLKEQIMFRGHKVIVQDDGLKIGCQHFSKGDVLDIYSTSVKNGITGITLYGEKDVTPLEIDKLLTKIGWKIS